LFDNDRPVTQHDGRDPQYELDIVEVADEIARAIPGVTSVRLFGSRKYPGKRRSDLDLLVSGPTSLAELNEFRAVSQHYLPLDLWLEGGETASSAVNGSMLPVAARSHD
jgi:predicted nucleotidyltransferase